jgi:hypothetical protein
VLVGSHESSRDIRPSAINNATARRDRSNSSNYERSFSHLDALVKAGFIVSSVDVNGRLGNDRPGVDTLINQMHGAARNSNSIGKCIANGMCAGKRRQ